MVIPLATGGFLAVSGVLIATLALLRVRRLLLRRRRSLPVTVVRSASGSTNVALVRDRPPPGPWHELRLAPHDPQVEVNVGDRLRVSVDEEMPSQAWLDRPEQRWHSMSQVVAGTLIALTGGAVLVAARTGTEPQTLSLETGLVGAGMAAGMTCLGATGTTLAATLLRALPGSRRVTGTVVDVETRYTGRKTLYQPRVEYHRDGQRCLIWGVPQWFRPTTGAHLNLRIGGHPPHEAVRTTPLALTGLALMLAGVLLGPAMLGVLAAIVLGR